MEDSRKLNFIYNGDITIQNKFALLRKQGNHTIVDYSR